jgi:hypothetical protein
MMTSRPTQTNSGAGFGPRFCFGRIQFLLTAKAPGMPGFYPQMAQRNADFILTPEFWLPSLFPDPKSENQEPNWTAHQP